MNASTIRAISGYSPSWSRTLSFRLSVIFVVSLVLTQALSLTADLDAECPSLVQVAQLILILIGTRFAVQMAILPLISLSKAVESLDPNTQVMRLDESGPTEVAQAAVALNAMQDRMAAYLKERMQILAAISHDLQTPITRMRLRAEFMDDCAEKDKLCHDLSEVEHLIREGVAFARNVHGTPEMACRIDLDAFLDSLVYDYQDMGQSIRFCGAGKVLIETQPYALRRLLVNLVDNAFKYGGSAEVHVATQVCGRISIKVLDSGPGIPEAELERVLQPFYRIKNERNQGTVGTGLGLAIAQQLSCSMGGSLTLSTRQGGGLCAQVTLGTPR